MVRFEHIYFRRERRQILTDVSFHMKEGEQWVFLGRNGSGKTTLLEMMNGYLFPTSGQVTVLGHRYGEVDVREVRKSIGYISQSLMEKLHPGDPVWEAVATGLYGFLRFYQTIPEEAKEQAHAVLERLNIGHLADSPLGVLSQGERKKAMLARALLSKPRLMIMDEPCAGLDLYEREKLLADLDVFREDGITVVYVTHHIEEIMPMFTHVLLLDGGRVVAAGPKEEVLTAELIRRAYQVDVEIEWYRGRPWIKARSS